MGSNAWQPGQGGMAAQRRRCTSHCAAMQPPAALTGVPWRPYEREPPRPAASAPPVGWHASTRRGPPSGDAVSAAARTGPPTAAVTAHRYRRGQRASGPSDAEQSQSRRRSQRERGALHAVGARYRYRRPLHREVSGGGRHGAGSPHADAGAYAWRDGEPSRRTRPRWAGP